LTDTTKKPANSGLSKQTPPAKQSARPMPSRAHWPTQTHTSKSPSSAGQPASEQSLNASRATASTTIASTATKNILACMASPRSPPAYAKHCRATEGRMNNMRCTVCKRETLKPIMVDGFPYGPKCARRRGHGSGRPVTSEVSENQLKLFPDYPGFENWSAGVEW